MTRLMTSLPSRDRAVGVVVPRTLAADLLCTLPGDWLARASRVLADLCGASGDAGPLRLARAAAAAVVVESSRMRSGSFTRGLPPTCASLLSSRGRAPLGLSAFRIGRPCSSAPLLVCDDAAVRSGIAREGGATAFIPLWFEEVLGGGAIGGPPG